MAREKSTLTVYVGPDELEQEMPGRFEVCGRCDGTGVTALHGIAIPADEFNGPDWDDEMREEYFAGGYDTPCTCCNGQRIVLVPDRKRATKEQLAARDENARVDAELRRDEMNERRWLGEG